MLSPFLQSDARIWTMRPLVLSVIQKGGIAVVEQTTTPDITLRNMEQRIEFGALAVAAYMLAKIGGRPTLKRAYDWLIELSQKYPGWIGGIEVLAGDLARSVAEVTETDQTYQEQRAALLTEMLNLSKKEKKQISVIEPTLNMYITHCLESAFHRLMKHEGETDSTPANEPDDA